MADPRATPHPGCTPFGRQVRCWRACMRILLIEMADAIGMKPSELCAYERGETRWTAEAVRKVNDFIDERHVPF